MSTLPDKINVLIFPAGSEIGIEIFHSIKYNRHVNAYGASGKSDYARCLYDKDHYFEGEYYIDRPNFIEIFSELIKKLGIKFIYPTHDTIALYLKENEAQLGAQVLTSDLATVKIARSKTLTYDLFSKFDFCPTIYRDSFENIKYPVFLKPDKGQGGKGALIAENESILKKTLSTFDDMVVSEFLPGNELSVDCFTDRHGKLWFVGPRSRERVQIGISFHCKKVQLTDEILKIAEALNSNLSIRGSWFFQLKADANGKYKLLEFAVRQASTMGLYRQVGVNFALLSLFDLMDQNVSVITNDYHIELERCLYNRYKIDYSYNKVYLDFDETLIIDDKVNEECVRYIYYCKNRNIKVILLTKHRYDLEQTLTRFSLAPVMFDKIVHINIDDDKSKYIDPLHSIFIDNHFQDRLNIKNKFNIPVFDVDAIESLIEN